MKKIKLKTGNISHILLLILFLFCTGFKTNCKLQIISTEPKTPAVLEAGQKLYINFKYDLGECEAVQIWARPLTNGQSTPGYAAHGSPMYRRSDGIKGTAQGYFFFDRPTKVDAIIVNMKELNSKDYVCTTVKKCNFEWKGTGKITSRTGAVCGTSATACNTGKQNLKEAEFKIKIIDKSTGEPLANRKVNICQFIYFNSKEANSPSPYRDRNTDFFVTMVKTNSNGEAALNLSLLEGRQFVAEVGEPYEFAVFERSGDLTHTYSADHIRIYDEGKANLIYGLKSKTVKIIPTDGQKEEEKPYDAIVLQVKRSNRPSGHINKVSEDLEKATLNLSDDKKKSEGNEVIKLNVLFENLPPDAVIAKVYDHNITLGNIEPDSNSMKKHQASDSNEQFKLWLKQNRASNLGQYFKPLWDDYVKEKGIEVTEQEINDYKERMINFMTTEKERWKIRSDSLAKELLATNLEDDKKAELEKIFKSYNSLIKNYPDPKLIYHSTDSNNAKLADNMAKTFILSWKINRELYKQYKGRVIFQQAGMEPLDAHRLFLEEQQSKGNFRFYNKDAEDLFWNYWRNTGCSFIKDPNEAAQLMNTPWWQREKEDNYYEDESIWGNDVNGFQIRIKASTNRGGRIFFSDKIRAFKMDLLNTGDETKVFCPALQQFCEVEVDGKWYKWNGPQVVDYISAALDSKQVKYDFLEIKLDENWILKEPLKDDSQKQLLPLSLNSHTIRVKYKASISSGQTETEVISNALKFKIVPPKEK